MDIVKEVWNDLSRFGFKETIRTLPEFFSWLRRVSLLHDPPLLKKLSDGSYTLKKSIRFNEFTNVVSGKFGIVYLVYREENEKEDTNDYVFLKTSPKYPKALLLEGILQTIAHTILCLNGFPTAVPRVLDIVKHPDFGIVFSVKRTPGSILFADYLNTNFDWAKPSVSNDRLVLEVIGQIATYLAVLESSIGLNHRDLKSTNVLIVPSEKEWSRTTCLNSFQWTIQGTFQVVLIDFGFACIGKPNGQTIVSAGEHLPTIDFCPKEGRDLFLLFSTLWDIPAFRISLTKGVQDLFKKWLQDWADWLTTSSNTNHVSMYLLTNADHFRSDACRPLNVLRDIGELYNDIVQIEKRGRSATPLPK